MPEVLKAVDFFDQGSPPVCVFRMPYLTFGRKAHSHDFYELMIITGGVARHCLEGIDPQMVSMGDVFVVHPGRIHSYDVPDGGGVEVVNVLLQLDDFGMDFGSLESIAGYQALFPGTDVAASNPHVKLDSKDLAVAISIIDSVESEMEEMAPGYEFLVESKLRELIVFLVRRHARVLEPATGNFRKLGGLVSHMERNLGDDLRFEQLVGLAGMSPTSLRRAFHHSFGCSPMGYLQRLRISKAMRLLADPEKSVTDVAFEVGFNDSSYFARVFKSETGESPSEFRERV